MVICMMIEIYHLFVDIGNSAFIVHILEWITDKPVIVISAGEEFALTFGRGGAMIVTMIIFFALVKLVAELSCKFVVYGVRLATRQSGPATDDLDDPEEGSLIGKILLIGSILIILAIIVNLNLN